MRVSKGWCGELLARWRVTARGRVWVALPGALLLLLALVGVSGMAGAPGAQAAPFDAPAQLPAQPSFSIINPAGLAGPAGTNVTAKITGAHKGQVYDIAYASADQGCAAMGASASNIPAQTIGTGGAVQFSFAWPADSGTGTFALCATNTATPLLPPVQSQQSFSVLSTTAPAITIQPAPQPTPTGTTTNSDNSGPQDSYTTGQSVIVQGTGFLPGGTSVQIALASTPNGDGTTLSQAPVNADTSGNFTTTVTLSSFRTGNLYIQALTTDGGANQPPSLLASAPISVTLAPTPTVQPSPTVTVTTAPTATVTGGSGGGSSNNDGTLRILGIAGLGSFSVLLLLVGAALLISAGSGREGQG